MIGTNHTFMDSQKMALTLDPGVEFHRGCNVLGDQGQRSSAQLCYFEKAGEALTSISFFLFFFKMKELLKFYKELRYI